MKSNKARKTKSVAGGNRTVVNGVSLIKIVANCAGPASLTEIAKEARMLPMRTQRYLKALVDTEMLSYNEHNGRYDLGPAVIDLGLTALGRLNSVQIASDVIYQLTAQTGLVSLLSVWGSHGSTVIKYEQGTLTSVLRVREGSNLPLLTSATGRVFLTFMSPADIRDVLKGEIAAARSNGRDIEAGPSAIEAIKREVRQHGMARSAGGTGHDAFAAPVFDHNGRLVMVVTLLSLASTFAPSYDGPPARRLKAAAAEISRKLGERNAARGNDMMIMHAGNA